MLLAVAKKLYRQVVRALTLTLWRTGYYRLTRPWLQRRTLTVVMFHRVLPPETDAYANSDREYAVSVDDFEHCLRHFKQHYNVVSLGQVQVAAEGGEPLPDHALLITFDDGWRDNVTYAGKLLEQHGLRAALFVNTDALEQSDNRWWADALVGIHRRQPKDFKEIFGHNDYHAAAQSLQALPLNERTKCLERWLTYMPAERQMLSFTELRSVGKVWDLGSHGTSHIPLPRLTDLETELTESAKRISSWANRPVETFAFPHGSCNADVARRALRAYRLIFTTEPILNRTDPAPGRLLGRINIPARVCQDPDALGHLLCARWARQLL